MWTSGGAVLVKVISTTGHLLLGYLLTKEDFGKLAMAYTVTAVASQISDPGVSEVLVQRGNHFRRWGSSAFWLSLVLALAAATMIIAAAPLASVIYGTPELQPIMWLLSLNVLMAGICIVPSSMLVSQMRFKAVMSIATIHSINTMVMTIVLAIMGFGVYSLVIPAPVAQAVRAAMLWYIAPTQIKRQFEFRRWKLMMRDLRWIFGRRMVDTISQQIPSAALGWMYGPAIAGPFYWGKIFAIQAFYLIAGNVSSVMFSSFTRLKENLGRQLDAALKVTRLVIMVTAPVCLLQTVTAEPLVRLLYGSKWDNAIPVIQWLSAGFAMYGAGIVANALMQSRGLFRVQFHTNLVGLLLSMILTSLGAYMDGATGAAIGFGMAIAIYSPVMLLHATRGSQTTLLKILRTVTPGLLTAVSALGVTQLLLFVANAWLHDPLMCLVASILIYVTCYGIIALSFQRNDWLELWNRVHPRSKPAPVFTG